ncbi:transglycosylase SLT domain-containing protein [Nocardia farcinica]|uniref:lytic transglycosylase domain-containing protein n=1 Tax=Nocardia farcinica TaxID=37329 RepID=UPI0018950B67|nr:transglycosylase SLT domain-containing protein [Nocardia farcinica]MBF6234447.1 transglycosylase SLT domain-containing protein [Nocardia farcinica]
MTLTVDDVAAWQPEQLTAAADHAKAVYEGIDRIVGKALTDTQALTDTNAWSGVAGAAARTRMDTEKSRASAVGAALTALETAYRTQVGALSACKDKVVRLRTTYLDEPPVGFEVAADGLVTAAARIQRLRDNAGGTDVTTLVLAEEAAAAQRTLDLRLALKAAEDAAAAARTAVATANTAVEQAFAALGDPKLGVPAQGSDTSTTPAAAPVAGTPPAQERPSYAMSGSGGGSGSSGYSGGSGYSGTSGSLGGQSSSAPTGPLPTGDVAKWIEDAKKILIEMGYKPEEIDERAIAMIIQHESGGNPYAENRWDSNWLAGHPSKGIMQTIDSTFNAYKAPGHDDIWNPVDNIVAAVRYSIDRYGSLSNVPGVAAVNQGGAYQGY